MNRYVFESPKIKIRVEADDIESAWEEFYRMINERYEEDGIFINSTFFTAEEENEI